MGDRSQEYKDYQQGELWKQGKGPAPNPVMYYWSVGEMTELCLSFGCLQEVIPLRYRLRGGFVSVWFKKGIGIVQEKYTQHNTTSLGTGKIHTAKVLKRFLIP
jgi:hypothetical protein